MKKSLLEELRFPLDRIRDRYNRRELIHPDPLEFLWEYPELGDREIVGLVASSLAYGRVVQILKSVRQVLDTMGPSPRSFVLGGDEELWRRCFKGFCHRFSRAHELVTLLGGVRRLLVCHGSLDEALAAHLRKDGALLPALSAFVRDLVGEECNSLLPSPARGSACKRLMLYVRWMVRQDDVDPGGWSCLAPGDLIIPLDTHMHRVSLALGLTRRQAADLKTALEVTRAFGELDRSDPVKYDFALTRFGIRSDMTPDQIRVFFQKES
ncbi:MAG: TIGR02757 family protein [Dethiosulfovibrio peptidovorans]|nr:MAG: TIGR02757 family protein [Dethiosulfovibrio peptidovorans]